MEGDPATTELGDKDETDGRGLLTMIWAAGETRRANASKPKHVRAAPVKNRRRVTAD